MTNNGAFSVSGGTFTQRGGSESGNAVVLVDSTLDDDTSAGAALFDSGERHQHPDGHRGSPGRGRRPGGDHSRQQHLY